MHPCSYLHSPTLNSTSLYYVHKTKSLHSRFPLINAPAVAGDSAADTAAACSSPPSAPTRPGSAATDPGLRAASASSSGSTWAAAGPASPTAPAAGSCVPARYSGPTARSTAAPDYTPWTTASRRSPPCRRGSRDASSSLPGRCRPAATARAARPAVICPRRRLVRRARRGCPSRVSAASPLRQSRCAMCIWHASWCSLDRQSGA